MTKLERSNWNQTQKLKWCKTKKKNCDNSKTQIVIIIKITVVTEVVIMTSYSKNTLKPWQPSNSQGSFSKFLQCFVSVILPAQGHTHIHFKSFSVFCMHYLCVSCWYILYTLYIKCIPGECVHTDIHYDIYYMIYICWPPGECVHTDIYYDIYIWYIYIYCPLCKGVHTDIYYDIY